MPRTTTEQAADFLLPAAISRKLLNGNAAYLKVCGVYHDFAIIVIRRFSEGGIPPRASGVGIVDYLVPEQWEDHLVCKSHGSVDLRMVRC
jgi:hypothetical protein